ncbi:unnamed protein product, partial [Arabidopsis halleri]
VAVVDIIGICIREYVHQLHNVTRAGSVKYRAGSAITPSLLR